MRRILMIVGICGMMGAWTTAEPRNPVGEKAHYVLDGDGERTSGLITDGTLDASVARAVDDGGAPMYETRMHYDLQVRFSGEHIGTDIMNVTKDFFSPDFIAKLRKD